MGLRVISMVTTVILARILNPDDFGIVATAQIALSTTGLFSGLGMGLAVIQSPHDRDKVAYQGFVVSAISGFVFFIVLVVNGQFFADLLGNPGIVSVLQWMSILVLLAALTTVPESLLQKDMLFGRVSIAVIVSEFTFMGLAVALATTGYGVWSLVYASIARAVVNLALVWFLAPGWAWIIRKPWDGALMKSLFRFGVQASGSGVVSFVYSVLDNFLVARYLGATAIGFYSKAYDFSTRTVDGFINVIGVVLFPSYSKIQDDKERLSNAYLKSLRVMSFFTVPVALGMFIVAEEMVPVLLGDKWLPLVAPFQILAFVSLIKPLSGSTGALFASTGYPEFNLRSGLCITVVMLGLIFAFLGHGIVGVSYAVLIAHVVGFVVNMYQVHLILPGTAQKMLTAVFPAVGGSVVMTAAVFFSKIPLYHLAGETNTLTSLVVLICIGIVVYCAILYVSQRELMAEIIGLTWRRFAPKQVEN